MREDYDNKGSSNNAHARSLPYPPCILLSLWPFMAFHACHLWANLPNYMYIVHVYIGYPSLITKSGVNLTQWLLKLCIFKIGSIHFNGCGLTARIQF